MDVFQKPAFWGIIAVVLIVVFAIFVIKSYVKKLSEGCCGSSGGDKVKKIKVKDKDKSHYPYKAILTVDGKGYGDFKTAVGEAVVEHLRPIQDEYNRIIKDRAYMEETWKKADAFAQNFSQRTLDKVMKKIGYIK